ncbi:tryptophan synthase subunit beta [candidate division KSB1 bacterium]|nr:tryptophan synthase subunit beta [candidate division KSB1 bacterium]
MNLFEFEKNREGFYGEYGGAYIPEILWRTFAALTTAFRAVKNDPNFWNKYRHLAQTYSGRPTPVTYLENISGLLKGAQIYAKREDLNQTGAHKINNVLGQGLLTERLGKRRVIAETGAGQHGVATATMAAKFGFECVIYMGEEDVRRQRPNVFWMEQLGAKVVPVTAGSRILKDAINEALRDWAANFETTHYVLGTACGPHPFPEMVAWFQSIIGQEARQQMLDLTGRIPDAVYACVGGGSNALGIFQGFLDDPVKLIGVEAGGKGLKTGQHAARLTGRDGSPGVAQGYKSYFLQNVEGQMRTTHSIAAGLDYIGVSPILSYLKEKNVVQFEAVNDEMAVNAAQLLMKYEGIIPALESSHAFGAAFKAALNMRKDQIVLVNLSGRGDKDIFNFAEVLHDEKWIEFLKEKVKSYES